MFIGGCKRKGDGIEKALNPCCYDDKAEMYNLILKSVYIKGVVHQQFNALLIQGFCSIFEHLKDVIDKVILKSGTRQTE